MSAITTHPQSDASHAQHGYGLYVKVFLGLLVLTTLTVALSYVDLGEALKRATGVAIGHAANIVAGVLVALLKAGLVIWFFMHQDHEEGTNRFIFAFSILLLTIAFCALAWDFVWLKTYVVQAAGAAVGGQ